MILATINGFALLLALFVAFLALLAGIAIGYEWGREAGIDEADDERAKVRHD